MLCYVMCEKKNVDNKKKKKKKFQSASQKNSNVLIVPQFVHWISFRIIINIRNMSIITMPRLVLN